MSVNRCYSEKKPGFDVEARSLFASLHDLLEIKGLTHVRYLCRYDTEGLAPEAYEKAKGIVFSEPMADVCYDEAVSYTHLPQNTCCVHPKYQPSALPRSCPGSR